MRNHRRRGVTLTELMVALVVLTVGVLGCMGAFKFISVAVSQSRLKTIAVNLAQEKMEVLKNQPYSQLLVTTLPAASVGYSPNFIYDNGNFPPETLTLWGGPPMTRSVNVDYASVSGTSVSTVPYTSTDPGMKKITVYVTWTERGIPKKVQLDSYYQSPSVATLDTGIKGQVRDVQSGAAVPMAYVQVVGAPKWHAYTDSLGNYSFSVSPGSFSVLCSSYGYYPTVSDPMLSVAQAVWQTWSPSILRIATGTVSADSVYSMTPGLVISQVVVSTMVPNGYDAQYVELFNPTTAQINVSAGLGSGQLHYIDLNIESFTGVPRECNDVALVYVSSYVAAGRYYLVANTSTFVLGGSVYQADAYFDDVSCSPTPPPSTEWYPLHSPLPLRHIMQTGNDGVVSITEASQDAVGWTRGSSGSSDCEGRCIPLTNNGFIQGDQIVRFSAPCAPSSVNGRAFDSGSNADNFYYNNTGSRVGLPYRLFNSTSAASPILSGVPAQNAYIFADDGNSSTILSSSYTVAGAQGQACPASSFTLVGVATGTWVVSGISGTSSGTVGNVQGLAQGFSVKVASNATTPAWRVPGYNHLPLLYQYEGGLAQGYVFGAAADSAKRLGGILVHGSSGGSTRTDTQGFYVLSLSTGTATVTANYNFDDPNYVSSAYTVNVPAGGAASVTDFHLSKGGAFRGYVTPGSGGLASIVVSATNGGPALQDTTDPSGYFYIFASTSSVPYAISPSLDTTQNFSAAASAPCSVDSSGAISCVMNAPGSTIFVGTFTVTGALGMVSGRVLSNGKPITTGVLITASYGPLPDPPAAVYSSSSPAQTPIYSASSQPDGTYKLAVRAIAGTTYGMRAFYPVVDVNTGAVSYTSKTKSGVPVNAVTPVTNQDFTWP